ncbi:hypothetical protein ACMFMG_011605 [Clarireedia jacksonii]
MKSLNHADAGLDTDALMKAIYLEPRPDLEQIKKNLQNGHDPNGNRDSYHLYSAIGRNQKQVVELLIQFGARLDIRTKQGTTVLHEAVKRRNRHIVRILIKHGADLEAVIEGDEYEGCTCIYLAVVNQDHKMVNLLLSIGACSTVASKHGWTPLDVALLDHQADIARLLINHTNSVFDHLVELQLYPSSRSAAPNEEAHDLALHILDDGFSKATRKHREIYLACLNKASHDIKIEDEYKVIRGLINGVQEALMKLAGRAVYFPEYRALCESCEKFQNRASQTFFNRFQHSEGIEALHRSAQDGCDLCCIFSAALNRGSEGRSVHGRKYVHGNPAVMLYIAENGDKSLSLHIEYSNTHSLIDLHYLQENLRIAVCSTPPTDKLSSNSERTFAIARALLETCETDPSHSLCQSDIPELPTRIIDVGSDSQQPRLLCSNKRKARYVTLSYCWGKGRNMKTTKENLDAHLRGIHLDRIPKTVRDAITITRELGIKYLWVDALCIIQDSREDLLREIEIMGDIYANSNLTIAAEDSKCCTDGIFTERNWFSTAILPLDLRIPHRKAQQRHISNCASIMVVPKLVDPTEYKRQTSLATRGWALQEYVLSSRILSYGNADLRWRCFEGLWSESNLFIDNSLGHSDPLAIIRDAGSCKDAHDGYGEWQNIVANYTSRQLTDPTDTLMALAGLQNRIGRILKDEPLLGLWRSTFFLPSLLWYCRSHRPVDKRFRIICPSWSWASVCAPVKYIPYKLPRLIFLPKLDSWDLESIEKNIHIRGSITLTCCILPEYVLQDVKAIDKCRAWKDPLFPRDNKHIWLLHLAEYRPSKGIQRFWSPEKPYSDIFMLIEKISQDNMHFRRVGLFQSFTQVWEHKCGVTETIQLF